jgi:pimeloyl-ACP methyl ester carboxylesterase
VTLDTENPRSGGQYERVIARSVQALADRYDPTAVAPPLEARVRLVSGDESHDALVDAAGVQIVAPEGDRPDAVITGPPSAWHRAANGHGGLAALADGIRMRHNLHVATGFLAATAGEGGPGRLRLETVDTAHGAIATAQAGRGPVLLAVHGLGGTKASFLPTLALLSRTHRVIAIDLPGFGDSVKPLRAAYDPHFFARAVCGFMDAVGIERAHLIGNSMGGRVAFEVGFRNAGRVGRIVGLSPSLAWLRDRPWTPLVKALRPELGLIQLTPRPVIEQAVRRFVPGGRDGWSAVGVDEFLRAYMQPRGRAAFYAALRNIYLDEPEGDEGFWTRLRTLEHESLFVWGKHDRLVPIAFAGHVREALPGAEHLELECGHVPQLEAPRETHARIRRFLRRE